MKKVPLVWQIVVGLLLGILVGWYLNSHPAYQQWASTEILKPLGDIFIKMMKMIVVPIVFCCMVLGIAGGGDNKSFGRMGPSRLVTSLPSPPWRSLSDWCLATCCNPGQAPSSQGWHRVMR